MPSSSTSSRRLAVCPDWLRTGTGRVAIGFGAAIAVTKGIGLFSDEKNRLDETALSVIGFAVMAFALISAWPLLRDAIEPRVRLAWRLFGFALGLVALRDLMHAAISAAFPRLEPLAHGMQTVFGLFAIVFVVAGLLALPTGRVPRRLWVAIWLDLATLLLAGFLGFWMYALHPALTLGAVQGPLLFVVVGHAVLALGLLTVTLLLFFRPVHAATQHGTTPLIAGAMLLVVAESIPVCHYVVVEGLAGEPGLVGWTLFGICLAVSARQMREAAQSIEPPRAFDRHFAVPFASTLLIGFLLCASMMRGEVWRQYMSLLLPATFGALVLIVLRQTLIARDNHHLAHEMARAKEHAESANSSRLQFLANISHDLRTPLNGVLGCAQILLREVGLTPKQKDLLKTMQGCAEHLRNLINDLLDLSKLEANRLELAPVAFDFSGFLQELVKTFTLEAENKNISINLEPEPGLPNWITCDRKRLQQILGNLVHNAIKFTDRGGVTLRVGAMDDCLVFDVRDTGCGILPDKIGGLFQPFHVVDERSIKLEGTGLGLSICKKLAQKMGGDITAQSIVGKGSTFTVRIPLQHALPVVEMKRTAVDYQGRRRRILIVDDKAANRVVLRAMLEPLDFLVEEASDAATALQQVRFAKPDVILMDLMMPGVDGFELCRQINGLGLMPTPICMAISAVSGPEAQAKCLETGFRDLLNKPVNLDVLLEALHTHAGIEWTYGVIEPPPPEKAAQPAAPEELVVPPAEELAAFLDLARRGFVRNLEIRAGQLEQSKPVYRVFANRVVRYVREFKLKELTDWLTSLSPEHVNGSS